MNKYKNKYKVKVYCSGTKGWYINGNLHRENGPAVEHLNGFKAWYLDGEPMTQEWYGRGEA